MTCKCWNTHRLMQVIMLPTSAASAATATFCHYTVFYLFLQLWRKQSLFFFLSKSLRGAFTMRTRVLTILAVTTYSDSSRRYTEVPYIKLQGRWLQALGFHTGSKVLVEESQSCIVVRLYTEQDGSKHLSSGNKRALSCP